MRIPYPKQRSKPKPEHLVVLQITPTPAYMGVIFYRTFSYSIHLANAKAKIAERNNVMKKLYNSKWGANPTTIRRTAVTFSYSTAEYACPVWERSTHSHKEHIYLNQIILNIYGCTNQFSMNKYQHGLLFYYKIII